MNITKTQEEQDAVVRERFAVGTGRKWILTQDELSEMLDLMHSRDLAIEAATIERVKHELDNKLRQTGAYDKSGNALDWFDKDDILSALTGL